MTPGKVWKLQKALYGTKQAGWCWWLHLKGKLGELGFVANPADASTYILKDGADLAFLWIHVDDGLLVGNSESLMVKLKARISKNMMVKWDEEVTSLAGIQIRATDGGFCLQQTSLIRKLLETDGSGMTGSSLLADRSLTSNPAATPDMAYLSHIGTLLYIAKEEALVEAPPFLEALLCLQSLCTGVWQGAWT